MNARVVVALLVLSSLALVPSAAADPICAGDGALAFCVEVTVSNDLLPVYCLHVQDSPCPDPNV